MQRKCPGVDSRNTLSVSITSTTSVPTGKWTHIAVQIIPPFITLFINGKIAATDTISGTPQSDNSYPLIIGRYNYTNIEGYLKDLRITKGVTRYIGPFTPRKEFLPYNKL
jgi:hypothetical protein